MCVPRRHCLSPWKQEEGQKTKFLRLWLSHVTLERYILQIEQSLAQKRLSFIHSFDKYLVRAFPGSGTVLGTMIYEIDTVLPFEASV